MPVDPISPEIPVFVICTIVIAILLPVGVDRMQSTGQSRVNIEECFDLNQPEDLNNSELDVWASRRVMQSIAGLLSQELRGEFRD